MAGKNTQGKNTQAKGNSNVHIESENSKTNDERLSVQHIHCLHKDQDQVLSKHKIFVNLHFIKEKKRTC